jgi:hypothetical protein
MSNLIINWNDEKVPKNNDQISVDQIKKVLGNTYNVSVGDRYDCEISKVDKRNIIGVSFNIKKGIIIMTYLDLKKHIDKADEWVLCNMLVLNLQDMCTFVKTYF